MKALVRHRGETIIETSGIEGVDWETGAPFTNAAWCGGPYQLVQNYVAPKEDEPETYDPVPEPEPAPEPEPVVEEETVVINGVTYTKAQLREMLGE